MLFSLLALVLALFAFQLSYRASDEITALLILLAGLLSLFLSILYSLWFIKLLIVLAILLFPAIRQPDLPTIHDSSVARFD